MSILTTPPETDAQRAARETVQAVQAARNAIIGILRDGTERLWGSPDPAGALGILGTSAGDVLSLYEGLIGFLQQVMTQAGDEGGLAELATIAARTPTLERHEDGTVTIVPQEIEGSEGEE